MSETVIESFNIENPPNLHQRESDFSTDHDISEEVENSNDNIIFQEDSLDIGKRNKQLHKAYCGIKGNSDLIGILNVTVSAIGGGCFSFPYMMYEGGILVIIIIFVFVTGCVYFSIDLLRSFVVDTKYFSFALMTETILGPKWLKIYAFSSFVIYVSMVINYLTSIYVYIQGMFDFNVLIDILYFFITMIIEIIICLYISKMNNMMHFLSITSITSFFLIIFSLIIISLVANIQGEVENKFIYENLFFPKISPKTFTNKILKIASYIMEYVYGYSYHSTFPTVIGYLNKVNNKNTKKIHLISFGIVVIAYILITFFGFILSNVVPNQLFQENDKLFDGAWGILRKPFKIVMVIYLLTLIPVRFIVIRDNYITLFGEKRIKLFSELVIIIIFIFICNLFVFGVGTFEKYLEDWDIRTLIQAFGGMFGVIISFCLPVINFISVNGKRKVKSIIGYIITGFFVLVGIFSLYYTFYKIVVGDDKSRGSDEE
jgi:amino acid permease